MEDVHPQKPFFEALHIAAKRTFHDVSQQLGGPAARAELLSSQNRVQMLAYLSR
jgi:hypothetical protein